MYLTLLLMGFPFDFCSGVGTQKQTDGPARSSFTICATVSTQSGSGGMDEDNWTSFSATNSSVINGIS